MENHGRSWCFQASSTLNSIETPIVPGHFRRLTESDLSQEEAVDVQQSAPGPGPGLAGPGICLLDVCIYSLSYIYIISYYKDDSSQNLTAYRYGVAVRGSHWVLPW